jgi:hypothetical protein
MRRPGAVLIVVVCLLALAASADAAVRPFAVKTAQRTGAASEAAHRPVSGHASSRTAAEFFAPRALAGIECGMYTVRCTSASNGITCVYVSGAIRGKGFRVSSSEAVELP